MLGNIHTSWLPISILIAFGVPGNVSAQTRPFSSAFLSEARITQSGKPVAVRIADPFARVDQERRLLKFLNEPHTFGWDSQTTISDIGRDVSKHVALGIDHRSLEEVGMPADESVFPNSGASSKKKRTPKIPPDEDPFADHPPESPATVLTTKSTDQHWWERNGTTTPTQQMTNAAVIFHALSNTDLVLATWSGRWLITTHEAAEENLSTRLYDVTPVINSQAIRPPHNPGGRMNSRSPGLGREMKLSADILIDVIQTSVDPDTWDILGGTSTCVSVVISGRTWLVTSAPVMSHWKVQALLNQLNGASD